jgi:hypothetical protein
MTSLKAEVLGSARVPRAGFGVSPKQSFLRSGVKRKVLRLTKVREGEDAFANTRDARAT